MEMERIRDEVFPQVFGQLPVAMASRGAKAALLAIGLQESRFETRLQDGGPARGYWQFEEYGGTAGVLQHASTKVWAEKLCRKSNVVASPPEVYVALAFDDVLACGFARLLLWTLPYKLAEEEEVDEGWHQYVDAWRPGMPHRGSWNAFWKRAWEAV